MSENVKGLDPVQPLHFFTHHLSLFTALSQYCKRRLTARDRRESRLRQGVVARCDRRATPTQTRRSLAHLEFRESQHTTPATRSAKATKRTAAHRSGRSQVPEHACRGPAYA